jgi:MFS family permease
VAESGGFVSTKPKLSRAQLIAVVAGNGLEFYDFLIFGFFAVPIGAAFFPVKDATSSLLLTLGTFAVGFVTRPLGGALIGRLGDRIGRKPAMLFSFGLMGLSIVGLALTPSYATIGVAAQVLVVIFRLLQGFALGGEVGPNTAYLMEAAPAEKRGLYVSLQSATQQAATFCVGIVGVVLAQLLTPAHLNEWGWRVAMLLGASVVPLALAVRRHLPETLEQKSVSRLPRPTLGQMGKALLTLLVLACATISTYVLIGINIFATHTLGLSTAQAFGAVVIGGSMGVVFNPIGGWLSDRLGRKPMMMGAYTLLCLVGIPCFMAMAQSRTPTVLYATVAFMAALLALGLPAIIAQVAESLPIELRSGGIGLIYALAISIFGGTTALMVTWLTKVTGSPLAPGWYMCGALALGVLSMLTLRETAPIKTGHY